MCALQLRKRGAHKTTVIGELQGSQD
jgi:hypothetical protein